MSAPLLPLPPGAASSSLCQAPAPSLATSLPRLVEGEGEGDAPGGPAAGGAGVLLSGAGASDAVRPEAAEGAENQQLEQNGCQQRLTLLQRDWRVWLLAQVVLPVAVMLLGVGFSVAAVWVAVRNVLSD
jgi:hypothetical protein